ncbi:hypothetical protein ADK65_01790 [Streptomyces sp. NRRL B-1140]|nr:hypothetical protein ADK65_01790 [Streptomyces sp. NRRL B-1140]
MGKTSLLEVVHRHAKETGALVLGALASRAERGVPMGVVRQLFGTAHWNLKPRQPERLTKFVDAAARLQVDAEWAGWAEMPRDAAEEAHGVIQELIELGPLVLTVDDVHNADHPSLQCLLYLVRRVAPSRMLLVLAGRMGSGHTMSQLFAEFVRNPACTLIRLAPLSDSAPLLGDGPGAVPSRTMGEAWLREAGGSPLLLHALASDRRGVGQKSQRAGETFRLAVQYLLDQLSEAELETAKALAILGCEATPSRLDRLTRSTSGASASHCTTLEELGLVKEFRYRSSAAAAVALDRMSPTERAAAHRRAARVVHDDGAHASVVARHLIAGGPEGGAWGRDVLRRAAQQELGNGAPHEAISWLRAAEAYPEAVERANVQVELLSAEWELNPAAAHRHLDPLLNEHRRGNLTPHNSVRLVAYLMWHGRPAEAAEILTDLGQRTDEFPMGLRMRLESGLAWFRHVYPLDSDAWYRPDEDVSERHRAAALHDPTLAPSVSAMAMLLHRQPHHALERQLLQFPRRSHTARAVLAAASAALDLQRGQYTLALAGVDQALSLIPPDAWGITVGVPLAAKILSCTALGDGDGAAACAQLPVPDAMFETLPGAHYLYARGTHHLQEGRRHAGLGDLYACRDLLAHWRVDLSDLIPWRSALAAVDRKPGRSREGGDVPAPKPSARSTTASITEAERRVATLAMHGSTNREIAVHLHLTVSTVEQHLTRVYRKLGISGRLDLSAALRM